MIRKLNIFFFFSLITLFIFSSCAFAAVQTPPVADQVATVAPDPTNDNPWYSLSTDGKTMSLLQNITVTGGTTGTVNGPNHLLNGLVIPNSVRNLNLGNYKVTVNVPEGGGTYPYALVINGNENLTVTGGTVEGNTYYPMGVTEGNGLEYSTSAIQVANGSNVTLSGVKINNNSSRQDGKNVATAAINVLGGSSLTVEGGTEITVKGPGGSGISIGQNSGAGGNTLTVNDATVQAESNSTIVASTTEGTSNTGTTIQINDGANIVAEGDNSAIWMANSVSSLTMTGGTISAQEGRGIRLSDGSADIRGGSIEADTAIAIDTKSTNGGAPMEPDGLDISGSASLKSTGAGNSTIAYYGTTDSLPDVFDLDISGGVLTAPSGTNPIGVEPAPEDTSKISITGGAFSAAPPAGTLSDSVQYGFQSTNGYYGYGVTEQQAGNSLSALDQAFPGQDISAPIVPINPETPSVVLPTPSDGQYVTRVSLGNDLLSYYNIGGTQQQQQSVGLNVRSVPNNVFYANNFTWTLSQVTGTPTVSEITFGDWAWNSDRTAIVSASGSWTLTQEVSGTGANTTPGDVTLSYSGSGVPVGIYELTVDAEDYFSGSNASYQSDSIRLRVSNTEIDTVDIVNQDGTEPENPLTVDYNTTKTAQFSYQALAGDKTVTGNLVTWSITYSGNPDQTSSYASINQKTGQIVFYGPTEAGDYLEVTVTVDGVESNPLYIIVTGNAAATQIQAWEDPLYLVNGPVEGAPASAQVLNYNLVNNLVTSPERVPVLTSAAFDNATYSFTSSNPQVIANGSDDDWNLIPANSSFTGSTTVTATVELNDEAETVLTTTFDVNIGSRNIAPTNITAEGTLNFIYGVTGAQNVNASVVPQTATFAVSQGSFSYKSSNEEVAYVDNYGNVRAAGVGTCTITTTCNAFQTANGKTPTVTTTVNVTEQATSATELTVDPTTVYLAPEEAEGATTSAEITATVDPENIDPSLVTWTADEGVTLSETTGLTTTVTSTDATGTYTVTASVPGADETPITATTTVIVSDSPVIIDPMKTTITANSPDFYTVTVAPTANPAVQGSDSDSVQRVSIFTWSQIDQTDMDCKVANQNADGTWSYEFPVNNTPVNEYYIDASDIIVQAYASTDPNSDGSMVWNTTWNYANCGWADGVIATPYVQDQGFIIPSVGNGAVAGTTGEARQMEGIRLSTAIEGVDLVYDVHVENIGWMDQVSEGVYAGTMHQNLQMEAVHISLTGANASQYTVQYQAHVQDIGWQNWVADGAEAGTTGQGLQMEAIRVQIVPVGTALPNNNV